MNHSVKAVLGVIPGTAFMASLYQAIYRRIFIADFSNVSVNSILFGSSYSVRKYADIFLKSIDKYALDANNENRKNAHRMRI